LGADLLPLRNGTTNPPGVAEEDTVNGQDMEINLFSWLPNPVRPKTTQMQIAALRGLSSLEPNHYPKQIPLATHAGIAGPGTRGRMVQ